MSDIDDIDQFFRGQRDAIKGEVDLMNHHPDYLRGYAAQYELEQVMTALRKGAER